MKTIMIFAGTTEGRIIAETLSGNGLLCEASVATEYGEQVLCENANLQIRMGRMDMQEMRTLWESGAYEAVIDATHPFATVVTENIRESLKEFPIPYYRVDREITDTKEDGCVTRFENVEECLQALTDTEGNILLTTGSKDLATFCAKEELKERIIARVLPGRESLELCYEQGLNGAHIIAMQGPFSKEMNVALVNQYHIAVMVTKESGKLGGLEEKVDACRACGIPCFVIGKPHTEKLPTYSVEDVLQIFQTSRIQERTSRVHVVLAGIGMGDPTGITVELQKRIAQTDYLFGAERMIRSFTAKRGKFPFYLEKDIIPKIQELRKNYQGEMTVTVLFSGDSGFYSGAKKMARGLEKLENTIVTILPGISSLSAFAAKVGESWEDAYIVSTHGVEENSWKSRLRYGLRRRRKIFFLTSGGEDIRQIGEMVFRAENDLAYHMLVGYQLSYPEESIWEVTADTSTRDWPKGLYVGMILAKENEGEQMTPGIADEQFIREQVPMTKEEVRTLSVCKMKLNETSVVYDIGSGTGSVSVEIALLSPDIRVYAIECNPAAVDLTGRNLQKFGLHNVAVIEATAPDGLSDLPPATHAFIGGSKGNLREILESLYRMNPKMRVVMNAVSMESVAQMQECLQRFPLEEEPDICMVSVSKSKKLGGYHMMTAQNPIWIFAFTFAP